MKSVFLSEFISKFTLNQKALDYENAFIESLTKKIKVPKPTINKSYEKIVYVGKDTLTKFSVHEFVTLKEDEKDYKEFMFVHSEQLALVLLKQKLKSFLECHFEEKVKYEKKDVKVCIIYIYSYNTICTRCSTSYLCDFHKAEGLKSEISKVFPEIEIYNVAVTQMKCDRNFLSNTKLPPSKHDFYDKALFQNQGQLIFEPSFNDYLYQYVLPQEIIPNETEIPSSQTEDE